MARQLAPRPPLEITPDEERVLLAYRTGAPPRGRGIELAIELVRAVRALVALAVLALIVLLAVSFASVPGQIGQRFSGAWQRAEQAVGSAGQAISDAFNPSHPPRYALSQDTEYSALLTLHDGDTLGDSADYTFTLSSIKRREDGGGNPDVAQYALLERRYTVPHATKILGLTIHVDNGEAQYVLDRGETFRIGSKLYKVNWLSATDQQLALGVYRQPDQFGGKLAFDSD